MTGTSGGGNTAAERGGRHQARSLPSDHSIEPDASSRLTSHTDILDLVVQNASLSDILQVITSMVEREITGSRATILLLDDQGLHVRVAAGPSLPPEFHAAIDGQRIGPGTGTCGTAAHENRVVITPDIAGDPSWDSWRPAAEAAGLAACWSTPFLGQRGRVLGTFAVYFSVPREPRDSELALLHDAGFLAAVAVQHDAVRRLLRHTDRTDPVTGIANRTVLAERMRTVEAGAAATGKKFAVIQVAVEALGAVNEAFGLSVGDGVLRTIGHRLNDVIDGRGLAAHLWGSDFAVLVEGLAHENEALAVAEQLRDALAEPLPIQGMTVAIDATLGVAAYGGEILNGPHPDDEPLRTANVAAERAKAAGNQIGVYDPGSDPGADVRLLGPALRRGLEQEELSLAYQPVVALADEHLDHFEALLRWSTPYGTVSPDSFVPVAEQTGLVHDLGRYALQRALADLARARAAGCDTGVSVNLSTRQLDDEGLPDLVRMLIAKHALPAASVTLEVTEGVLLTSSAAGWDVLSQLSEVGVRISLDDFGTGFSQINYLRRYRFDEVKLDRVFVREMANDVTARAIIIGTLAFAGAAGMTTVAEGIEHRDQADRLRDLGCTYGQGYLFGAARPELTG